jgi:anti-sigma B factor antagonist
MRDRYRTSEQWPEREMVVQRCDAGPVAVIDARGEVDPASAPKLGVAIYEAVRQSPDALVIDLCHVSFLDSAWMSILLNARRLCVRRHVSLKLACDVPSTLQLLALTRLDFDFATYPSRKAALAAVAVEQFRRDN